MIDVDGRLICDVFTFLIGHNFVDQMNLLQLIEYLIHEVVTDQKSEDIAYQPSIDINQLNVALLLDRLDTYGSEDFKVDKDEEFSEQWKVLLDSREEYYKKASKVLLKDL